MAIIGGTKLNSILNGVELQICEAALNVVKANSDGNDQKKIDRLLKKLNAGKSFSNLEIYDLGSYILIMLRIFDDAEAMGHKVAVPKAARNHAREVAHRLQGF